MPVAEFQTESSICPASEACENPSALEAPAAHQSEAAVQSLLLGLHFRHRLTESESLVLETLVPDAGTAFLRLGEVYIYPENSCDIPVGAVPTAQVTGTDAIFTHRWQPARVDPSGARRLHTASLGLVGGQDLMLGVIEPDPGPEELERGDWFGILVSRFRQALIEASMVARALRTRLSEAQTWLLINRASGRVIAAGKRAGLLLGLDEFALIGREYSSLSEPLGRTALGSGLRLNNVEIGDQHLTIVTFLPTSQDSSTSEPDQFFSDFFAHAMRNKLSAITTASSHLESLSAQRQATEEGELAAIIQAQAEELDRQIERLQVLYDYDRLTPRTTMVDELLDNLAGRLEGICGRKVEVSRPAGRSALSLAVPSRAGEILLEAVVLAHRRPGQDAGSTDIEVTSTPDRVIIKVTSRFSGSRPPAPSGHLWHDYIGRLAVKLNLTCKHNQPDHDSVSTVINAPRMRK